MKTAPVTTKQLQLAVASHYNNKARSEWEHLLTKQNIHWFDLARSASTTGLIPLLYGSIPESHREALPKELSNVLADSYYETVSFNVLLLNELKNAANLLSKRQIPFALLKGASLLVTVYESLAFRPMVDIDLLIRHSDLEKVLEALRALGYSQQHFPPFPNRDGLFWNETLLIGEDPNNLQLELHWNLIDYPPLALSLPASILIERSRIVEYDDVNYQLLSPVDQIMHLSVHNTYNHRNQLTRSFVDIAMIIKNFRNELDWNQLIRSAVECKISRAVLKNLQEASDSWYASVPSAVLTELARTQSSSTEIVAIYGQRSEFLKLLRTLLTLPGFQSKFEFFKGQLFPSRDFLVWRYGRGSETAYLSLLVKRYFSGIHGLLREILFWFPLHSQKKQKKASGN